MIFQLMLGGIGLFEIFLCLTTNQQQGSSKNVFNPTICPKPDAFTCIFLTRCHCQTQQLDLFR